jgi:hypothetical protein
MEAPSGAHITYMLPQVVGQGNPKQQLQEVDRGAEGIPKVAY